MKIRNLSLAGLFIAISFIGANIKLAGSVAFDSMAGFLGSLILGPAYGALIGALGHFLTAATSGFLMSIPVHMIIMIGMAFTMYAYGALYDKISKRSLTQANIIAGLAAIIINGPLSLLMVMPLVGTGVIAMLPLICLATLLNLVIAQFVYKFLPESIKLWKSVKSEI